MSRKLEYSELPLDPPPPPECWDYDFVPPRQRWPHLSPLQVLFVGFVTGHIAAWLTVWLTR